MQSGEEVFMGLENVTTCKVCRRIFQYPGFGPELCPLCRKADEEEFQKVKTFLRDNPGSTLSVTSEACGVSQAHIRLWLRDERLEYDVEGDTGLVCEECGKPIRSGRLCDGCRLTKARVAGELTRSVERPENAPVRSDMGERMRFLGRR